MVQQAVCFGGCYQMRFADLLLGATNACDIYKLTKVMTRCSSTATVTTGGSQAGTSVTAGSAASSTGPSDPSGTSGSTSSTSAPTPLDNTASIGSIAASTVEDSGNKVYVHLYYQQGSNIAYRTYPGKGSFSVAQALPLKITPKTGSAIAASEFLDSVSNYVSHLTAERLDSHG